ncbi:MAG: ABC transporter substrate-binding protein [Planctomycetota bacterium]|jgi:ABC-type oligopeptide transport system substrate-binding subunit
MKWFYTTSIVVVALLAASPFFLLDKPQQEQFAGKVVLWDTYGAAVKSIDPASCGDVTSSGIQGNVFEGLYGYHYLKRPPEVIPVLAADMPKISPDGLTYTIRLKDDVYYHRNPCFGEDPSGEHKWATRTVEAKDFVLAFKRIADYHVNTGLAWAFLSQRIAGIDDYRNKTKGYKIGDFSRYDLPIKGIRALDELTLQISLQERFPQFIYVLAMHVYAPIPQEAVGYWLATRDDGKGGREEAPIHERATEFKDPRQLVGTGPYLLTDWKRKSLIVLARNTEYRPDTYPTEGEPEDAKTGLLDDAGKPVPFIDVLHYEFVEEAYTSWMLFLTKRRDVSGIPRETFDFIVTPGRELTEKWKQRHIYLSKYTSPVIYWIVFNMEDPVFKASKSLRQAICLVYDVENHIKVLYNGRGKRAVNIIPSTFKGHKETGPGAYYRLDIEAAKQKLSDARKELAAAGLLVDGEIPELKLEMGDRTAYATRFADFARQQFGKLGLKLKVVFQDWPTLQQRVHNKQAQMYTMGWHADYPDAENFFQLFYSGNIDKGTNNSNYSREEFDRLYEDARIMDDTPKRMEMYVRMGRMIGEDCPVLLLSEPQSFVLFYEWLRNVKPHPIGYGFRKYRQIDKQMRSVLGGGR